MHQRHWRHTPQGQGYGIKLRLPCHRQHHVPDDGPAVSSSDRVSMPMRNAAGTRVNTRPRAHIKSQCDSGANTLAHSETPSHDQPSHTHVTISGMSKRPLTADPSHRHRTLTPDVHRTRAQPRAAAALTSGDASGRSLRSAGISRVQLSPSTALMASSCSRAPRRRWLRMIGWSRLSLCISWSTRRAATSLVTKLRKWKTRTERGERRGTLTTQWDMKEKSPLVHNDEHGTLKRPMGTMAVRVARL